MLKCHNLHVLNFKQVIQLNETKIIICNNENNVVVSYVFITYYIFAVRIIFKKISIINYYFVSVCCE